MCDVAKDIVICALCCMVPVILCNSVSTVGEVSFATGIGATAVVIVRESGDVRVTTGETWVSDVVPNFDDLAIDDETRGSEAFMWVDSRVGTKVSFVVVRERVWGSHDGPFDALTLVMHLYSASHSVGSTDGVPSDDLDLLLAVLRLRVLGLILLILIVRWGRPCGTVIVPVFVLLLMLNRFVLCVVCMRL